MNAPKRILIVEDDLPMAMGLEFNLRAEGFSVEHRPDGETGLERAIEGRLDLVVLDMLLPGISGLDVLDGIRQSDLRTPILILSATASSDSVVLGLQKGADDYLTKPFELEVLLARIKSLMRTRDWLTAPFREQHSEQVRLGGRVVDFRSSQVSGPRGVVDLSFKEAQLLRHLMEAGGRTVTREELLREVWGYSESIQTRTIDNFVVALRKKIEDDPKHPLHIQTVPGEGYRFQD
ncbi:MAG: response regulator transcription factor [Fibrobacteres bacterium]|nr:response regulator transcription factor [Fibrobacterota bacterium]